MDEADVLGDRIAIMADGSLKCCGRLIRSNIPLYTEYYSLICLFFVIKAIEGINFYMQQLYRETLYVITSSSINPKRP